MTPAPNADPRPSSCPRACSKTGGALPPRRRAALWEQMQYVFQAYNDHQIHAVLRFPGMLDADTLSRAAEITTELIPQLGSRFRPAFFRPFWERLAPEESSVPVPLTRLGDDDPEGEIFRFVTAATDELVGPQLRAGLFRSREGDVFCLVMNHMICDGAGFQEYLGLLAEIYTRLKEDTLAELSYRALPEDTERIYRRFSPMKRLGLRLLPPEPSGQNRRTRFPFSRERQGRTPFLCTLELDEERFDALKRYGAERGATVNDVVLTAFFRALNRMPGCGGGTVRAIPCMVDLRRYLPGARAGVRNLVSKTSCRIGPVGNDTFEQTLGKVSREMTEKKRGCPGLGGLAALRTLYRLPFGLAHPVLRRFFPNPLIGMSNIGVLDEKQLSFAGMTPRRAFVTGSLKHPPYFQLALSTYRRRMTFTVGEYGRPKDRQAVEGLLSLLEEELRL